MDRAVAYARKHDGKWFIIRSDKATVPGDETPAQWLAWRRWFFTHGFSARFLNFLDGHGIGTVPSEWPEEFDIGAEVSDHAAGFPSKPFVSPEKHDEVLRGLRSLGRNFPNDHRPRGRVMPTPDEVLADIRSAYARAPAPTASPALLATVAGGSRKPIPEPFDDNLDF